MYSARRALLSARLLMLCESVEGVVLVTADIVEISRAHKTFDDALSGGAGESCDAFNVGTTDEGVGLEIVLNESLDFVERDVGRVGLLCRAFEA